MITIQCPREPEWIAAVALRTVEEVTGGYSQREGGFRVLTELRGVPDPTRRGNVDCGFHALDGLGAEECAWLLN